MKLQAVTLSKEDTCLTYALKRVGLIDKITTRDTEYLEEDFFFIPYESQSQLTIGSILVFSKHEKKLIVPDTIDVQGRIISHERLQLRHLAVYEGNGLISDCTTITNYDFSGCRIMRMRELHLLKLNPSFVLRAKD